MRSYPSAMSELSDVLQRVPDPSIACRFSPSTWEKNIHPSSILGVELGLGSIGIVGELYIVSIGLW